MPTWIFYDFETTGLNPSNCEVIQIGALAISNGNKIAQFQTLIKSIDKIPEKVVEITKITDKKIEYAPNLETGWKLFFDWILNFNPIVMIGHNSNKFDKLFLDRALTRFPHPLSEYIASYKHLDTLEISRNPQFEINPPNYKLISLIDYFGISCNNDNLHGALYDSLMTFKVFKEIILKISIDSVAKETIWSDPSLLFP